MECDGFPTFEKESHGGQSIRAHVQNERVERIQVPITGMAAVKTLP